MVFEKLFMKILNKERKPKQISILIIGLNNSGKSTIVNFFKNKDDRKSISVPTIGFNIEHFESEWKSFAFTFSICYSYFSANEKKILLWLWPSATVSNQLEQIDRLFMFSMLIRFFLLSFHPIPSQIKVFRLQLMTWQVSGDIATCGSIISKHVTVSCSWLIPAIECDWVNIFSSPWTKSN